MGTGISVSNLVYPVWKIYDNLTHFKYNITLPYPEKVTMKVVISDMRSSLVIEHNDYQNSLST